MFKETWPALCRLFLSKAKKVCIIKKKKFFKDLYFFEAYIFTACLMLNAIIQP